MKNFNQTSLEVYGTDEIILSSLNHTLEKIDAIDGPHNLEMLLTFCPYLMPTLRRCILLLSENVRDHEHEYPLCHVLIFKALERTFGSQHDDSSIVLPILAPCETALFFTQILCELIMENFALKIKGNNWEWDLETAFETGDYLFKRLALPFDEISVEKIQIQDHTKTYNTIMNRLLTPKFYETLRQKRPTKSSECEMQA